MAINLIAALSAFKQAGIDPKADFHSLPSGQVDAILAAARAANYRKPLYANGSKARYFFYAVQRMAGRAGK